MQLELVFEILLLVSIVAGVFVGWDGGTEKEAAAVDEEPAAR